MLEGKTVNLRVMEKEDVELIDKLFGNMVISLWEKLKPVIEGTKKQFVEPRSLEWFEYFYNEMKKREQKGVRNG